MDRHVQLHLPTRLMSEALFWVSSCSLETYCGITLTFLLLRYLGLKSPLQACNFIKKRLQHRCFPVKFAKFLRPPFSTEYLRWLLLYVFISISTNFFKIDTITGVFLLALDKVFVDDYLGKIWL